MKFNKIVIIGLLLIISSSFMGTVFADDSYKEYNSNGVLFQYPDDWTIAHSISEGSVAAIAYKNDSSISIVIQQVPSELGTDLQTAYNTNNNNLAKSGGNTYSNLQETQTNVSGKTAIVHRYITTTSGVEKEHIATWLKMDDGKLYVILYSAPIEYYEQESTTYDNVVSTFELSAFKSSSNIFSDISNEFMGLFH